MTPSAEPVEVLLFAPSPLAEALAASLPVPLAAERVLSFTAEEEIGAIFHRLQERVSVLLASHSETHRLDEPEGSGVPVELLEGRSEGVVHEGGEAPPEPLESAAEEEALLPHPAPRPLLILCDQLGGRACTLALSLTHEPLEVLTGVNLPLLSALASAPRDSLSGLSSYLTAAGQRAIRQSSVALTPLAARPA